MNSRFLLPVLAILIILPFFVFAQGEYRINDELGIMGIYKTEAEGVIKNLEDTTDVKIMVYISSETFDEEDFYSIGNYTYYYGYNLDERGNPVYNVLIFYTKVDKNYRLGYFHSSPCEPFVEFLETLKQGDVGQGLSGGELLTIIEKLSQGIRDIINEYGEDCEIPSEETEEIDVTKGKTAFLIDDANWKDVLSLYPITTYHYIPEKLEPVLKNEEQRMQARKSKVMYNPTLVYHREGEEVDLESTLIFLKQFRPDEVVLVGVGNENISGKLTLALEEYETREIKADEYQKLWENKGYEYVVVSENDYQTGLLASIFASYLNAPLLFSVSDLENYEYEKLYCIGKVNHEDCSQKYTLEELQKRYSEITNTDKVILVNPQDIEDQYCENFEYTNEYGILTKAYCKDSLTAPLLSTLKNELIVFTEVEPLSEGLKKILDVYDKFYVDKDENVYYLWGDRFAKANFQRDEIRYYEPEEYEFPLEFSISPNGDIYVIGDENLFKLEEDELKKVQSIDERVSDKFFDENTEILNVGVDNEGSLYILYNESNKVGDYYEINLMKYKEGIIYDKVLLYPESAEEMIVFLKDFAKREFPENTRIQLRLSELEIKDIEIKVTSEGVYLIFVFANFGQFIAEVFIIYEFNEEYDYHEWLDDEEVYKIIFFDGLVVGYDVYMGDDKKLYINPHVFFGEPFVIVSYPEEHYKLYGHEEDIDFYLETSLFEFNKIFVGDEKIYVTVKEEPIIMVFEKSKLTTTTPRHEFWENVRLMNGRFDCKFYEMGLNPEKKRFEEEIIKKSEVVKFDLDNQIKNITDYLTTLAGPRAIPMSKYHECVDYKKTYYDRRASLDRYYAGEMTFGRIFGISVSDTSSYVNRIVAFSKRGESFVPQNGLIRVFQKIGLLSASENFRFHQRYIPHFSKRLTEEGYLVSCFVESAFLESDECELSDFVQESFLAENDIILYDDHGSVIGWANGIGSLMLEEMYSPIIIGKACSTMNYYVSYKDYLFGPNLLRKGGLGYYGALSITDFSLMGMVLLQRILEGYDLGNAFISALSDKSLVDDFRSLEREPNYILLGDPTIKPALLKEVKLEYEPEKADGGDYECYPVNGETVCERTTETAKVEICGETSEMRVTLGDYEKTVENPLSSLWNDFSPDERGVISRYYNYLTSNLLPLSEAYDSNYNLYYQCPSYVCGVKYCECYDDQAACKENYKETAKNLLGISTIPTQPEPTEPAPQEGKKSLHVCRGKINMEGSVEGGCSCTPCTDIDPGQGTAHFPDDPFRCNRKAFYKLDNSKISPYTLVLSESRTSDGFLCITECSTQGKCTSSYVEYDPDLVLRKFGGQ